MLKPVQRIPSYRLLLIGKVWRLNVSAQRKSHWYQTWQSYKRIRICPKYTGPICWVSASIVYNITDSKFCNDKCVSFHQEICRFHSRAQKQGCASLQYFENMADSKAQRDFSRFSPLSCTICKVRHSSIVEVAYLKLLVTVCYVFRLPEASAKGWRRICRNWKWAFKNIYCFSYAMG